MTRPRPTDTTDLSRRTFLRFAGAGLGAAAAPAVLGGCGGGGAQSGAKASGVKGVPPVQFGAADSGVLYPPGYVGPRARAIPRIKSGGRTFKIVVPQSPKDVGDWNKNAYTKWLEKRTGVKVEFQAVPIYAPDGSQDLTKVNAMLSAGELPDAFLGVPLSAAQISLYGSQGTFVPLDDYVQTYAPYTRQSFKDYPDWKPLITAADGKMYQIKDLVDCYHCRVSQGRAFVNREYVDAVGGAVPTTTDELRELLKMFKAKDPSPHHDIIPFGANVNPVNAIDRYLMNSFLYNPGGSTEGGWMRLNRDKVEFVADKDEWREALRYLRQLSDDGTLSRNAFTMTDDAFLAAGNQGRMGFVRAYFWGVFVDIEYTGRQLWKDYVSVPPLKGPNGVQYAQWDYYLFNGACSLVITKDCKEPEVLVQWADAQMELEAGNSSGLGPKDTGNWGWAKKGQKGINGKQAVYFQKQYPPPPNTSWGNFTMAYQSNDARLGLYVDPKHPDFEQALYDASTGYRKYAQPQSMELPPLLFDTATAGQIADTATAIQGHVTQSMAKFAIGELNVNDDGAWQDYLDAFKKIGLKAYLQQNQKAYDHRPH